MLCSGRAGINSRPHKAHFRVSISGQFVRTAARLDLSFFGAQRVYSTGLHGFQAGASSTFSKLKLGITTVLGRAVSGGSMNPARTLGPALASNLYTGLWVYFLGPVLGTLSGAWNYTYIRFEEAPSSSSSSNKDASHKLSSFKLRRLQSQPVAVAEDDEFEQIQV